MSPIDRTINIGGEEVKIPGYLNRKFLKIIVIAIQS